ncbi:Oidioi.mRNA.OKI2018_I69.chr1.g1824.t1.cds [Oikopleura dioica]|uniref:5'-deoxynucleotidase HDDC2 n=1 Tax=Oikopleura dioica TaxID=34765 RepID=A0ABN7STC8_OIKDI|nr:Oidioi.mRNA.OKI2018_I69.chr1.g1824.t1.cds [Oikopleura dioica]
MNILPFLRECLKIKKTVRTGWVRLGVKEPENVSEHMYFMALMALSATPKELNKDRCMKIAIVHDLAECITGDIVPEKYSGVSETDKHKMEREAIEKILGLLKRDFIERPDKETRDHIRELYDEYENQTTPEAKWVKDLDKLELIHQAIAYEKSDNLDLSGIIENTQAKVKTDAGKELLRELEDERNAYAQNTADKSPK